MLVKLNEAVLASCGGKAHTLGTLLRSNFPVPEGFVVPFATFRAAKDNRSGVIEELRKEIAGCLECFGDTPLAVRSSGEHEDGSVGSAAGQHESVLGVQGLDSVLVAVQDCWASLYSERAASYRAHFDVTRSAASQHGSMAVIVQRLVDSDVSGVMFTPAMPDGVAEIEASWGLGVSVVGGTVTPDRYRIDRYGAVTTTIADKHIRTDRRGTKLVTRDVTSAARDAATLDDLTAVRLAQLGHEIATVLGGPQDIEWSIVDGRISVLQARPITAALPFHRNAAGSGIVDALFDSPLILTGAPGSAGRATGTARIIRGPGDFGRVGRGDILVCPYTDPAWTPLLRTVKGVVTETGGVLSHAAIVAREFRIPAVLGVAHATDRLRDNDIIDIDGEAGTITNVHS